MTFLSQEAPPFLRFRELTLWFSPGTALIEEKCNLYADHLLPLKHALNSSNLIYFNVRIDQNDPSHFRNTSMLIESLQNGLLPICDSSNCYKFVIDLVSDKNAGTELISSILQLPQINRCPNVCVQLYGLAGAPTQLPVKAISQFLHMLNICRQKFLRIYMHQPQNIEEMCDYLEKVNWII